MKTKRRNDLRVDLIRRIQNEHMISMASTKDGPGGEKWRCRCGKSYAGDGAIEKGRRHEIKRILEALDAAAAVA